MAILRAKFFALEWVCTGDSDMNGESEAYFWLTLKANGEHIINPNLLVSGPRWGIENPPYGSLYGEDALLAMKCLRSCLSKNGKFLFWNYMDDDLQIDFERDGASVVLAVRLPGNLFKAQHHQYDESGKYDIVVNLEPDPPDLEKFFFELLDEFEALELTPAGRDAFATAFGDLDRGARHVPWIGATETEKP